MSDEIDPKVAEELKSRANDASQRYQEYLRAYQTKHPEMTDQNAIFQAWVIMYLAHLQFAMDGQNARMGSLHADIRLLQGYTRRGM